MRIHCPHCKDYTEHRTVEYHGAHDGHYQSMMGPRSDYRTVRCTKCKKKAKYDFGGDR